MLPSPVNPLGTVATSVLFADHARVQYEDRQLLRHLDQEAADAARAEIRAQRGMLAELNYQIRENRNAVVGISWLTCMAGSLGYTFSKKGLTTTQRIVTARKSLLLKCIHFQHLVIGYVHSCITILTTTFFPLSCNS